MSHKKVELAKGAEGLFIANDRFNTTLITCNFFLPANKATVAEYALLPFILTSCSKKYPDFSRLNYKLNKLYGARLDASTEKYGDYQLLRMKISVINDCYNLDGESLVSGAAELLLGLIFEPNTPDNAFVESDLNREKRKAIEHIKGEISEKRIYAKNRLIEEMYRGSAYGLPKCGRVEDVEKITGESLYKAWQEMLKTAFIRVQVVGAALPTGLFDAFSQKFSELERENICSPKVSRFTEEQMIPVTVTENMDITQGKLCMGFSSEVAGNDDVSLPLLVMTDIFGGGPYSRLFSNVREKMSLCYYCSATSVRQKGLITVESGVEFENANKAETEILNQLEIIKKGEFSDFEFNSSIKSIKDSLNTYNDSQNALDTWYLLKVNNDNIYSPSDISEKISNITREDVVKTAEGVRLHTVYKLLGGGEYMKKEIFKSDIGESYILAELQSGLKIYILEKPQYNSSYAIFGTKYGSIDTCFNVNGEEVSVPEGIAHFLEHKLFESEDGDAFTKYAETGAYANAFTSFDKTCYIFSCSDRFYENLKILLNFVQSPYFTAETVAKEQGIIGQEIRMYDDSPSWRVMFNMLGAMYHNHPVKIDIAGTVESIAQIDHNLLYKCYNTFYNPSNMFICIAGNVDAEKVLKQIKEQILPSQAVEITRINKEEPKTVVEPYVEQSLSVAQPMFCFGYKEDGEKRTVKQKICTCLLLEILAGDASPLYKELVNEGLINDEFSFEYFTGNGYAAVIFDGESNNPKAVAEKIKAEVERLKLEGIDKKLFSAIRCGMYGNAIRLFQSVDGIAMQMADCAMNDSGLFDDIKYLRSVTIEDVYKRLLLLDNDKTVLSVINPKEK